MNDEPLIGNPKEETNKEEKKVIEQGQPPIEANVNKLLQGQPYQQTQGQPPYQPIPGQPPYQPMPGQFQYMYQPIPGQIYQPMGGQMNSQVYYPPIIAGLPAIFVEDPLLELANTSKALIKQQLELLEIMTGCETPNRYHIFVTDQQGSFKYLFKCKEYSTFCVRNCCAPEMRPFLMKMKHIHSHGDFNDDFEKPFIEFNRPFKCTCWCLARPEMRATHIETGVSYGKVVEPCTCCDPKIRVTDQSGVSKYILSTNCCQCGFCCRNCICGIFNDLTFNIYDANDVQMTNPVGTVFRKKKGLMALVSDADTYELSFPVSATPEEKVNLIGAVMMIDYRYFEQNVRLR